MVEAVGEAEALVEILLGQGRRSRDLHVIGAEIAVERCLGAGRGSDGAGGRMGIVLVRGFLGREAAGRIQPRG